MFFFFFSSRRRHTRFKCDWSSDVCSSDLIPSRPEGDHPCKSPTRSPADLQAPLHAALQRERERRMGWKPRTAPAEGESRHPKPLRPNRPDPRSPEFSRHSPWRALFLPYGPTRSRLSEDTELWSAGGLDRAAASSGGRQWQDLVVNQGSGEGQRLADVLVF